MPYKPDITYRHLVENSFNKQVDLLIALQVLLK